jgi:hypothetical protein
LGDVKALLADLEALLGDVKALLGDVHARRSNSERLSSRGVGLRLTHYSGCPLFPAL